MKIVKVSTSPTAQSARHNLESYGMIVQDLSPTLLSAFTAMKIAKTADQADPGIIAVFRQKDALAAISAKNITKNNGYKIVYVVLPNTTIPPVFHKPVVEGVDSWLFFSSRLKDAYPAELHNKLLLPAISIESVAKFESKLPDDTINIACMGDIVDTERLKKIIAKVEALDGRFTLRISGGGKARDVMPAVRYARAIRNPDKVIWVGEEYDRDKEIAICHAAVRSNEDMTFLESHFLQAHRPVLDIDEIDKFVDQPYTLTDISAYSPEKQVNTLRTIALKIKER